MTALVTEQEWNDDDIARLIAQRWTDLYGQRETQRQRDKEVIEYLHASSIKDTTNYKDHNLKGHTTNIPMLYKHKEVLVAMYMDMWFPNSNYMKWEQDRSMDEEQVKKGRTTAAYIQKKLKYVPNAKAMRQLAEDFVTYGRIAALTDFERVMKPNNVGGMTAVYEGPIIHRLHPDSYVFDVTAADIRKTPKIIRHVYSMAEIVRMHEDGSKIYTKEVVDKMFMRRSRNNQGSGWEQANKYANMAIQGYGDYNAYLQSGHVEILAFLGDLYDNSTNKLLRDQHILVLDRDEVVYRADMNTVTGDNFFYHVYEGFESTLGGIGPLHKVVGLQYAMNHVQNMKANALDLELQPPLKFQGGDATQPFGAGERFVLDIDEDVNPMNPGTQALQVNAEQGFIMSLYDQVTGVPSELSGIRTAGEKTAFEVDQILSGGQRIPTRKAAEAEQFFWEPLIRSMLEQAQDNMALSDYVKVINDSQGVETFVEVTKDSLVEASSIYPIGARGLAEEARSLREFHTITQNPIIAQLIQPHTSGKALVRKIEKSLNWEQSGVFRDYVQLAEQAELQDNATVASQKSQEHAVTPETEETPANNAPATI